MGFRLKTTTWPWPVALDPTVPGFPDTWADTVCWSCAIAHWPWPDHGPRKLSAIFYMFSYFPVCYCLVLFCTASVIFNIVLYWFDIFRLISVRCARKPPPYFCFANLAAEHFFMFRQSSLSRSAASNSSENEQFCSIPF